MTTEITPRSWMDETDLLPDVIPGAATLEPGRLSWYHGVSAGNVKTPGVFFGRDTAFVDAPGAPWTPDDRYSDKGELGYCASELRLAFIANRSQWFIPAEEQGKPPERWLAGYEDGAKKLTEYLVMVDGLDDPMVLSVSGKYKAGPLAEILSAYRRGALAQAMRKTRRTLPPWAFWLPIAGRRDANGKPVYEKAAGGDGKEYGSIVTPMALAGAPSAVTTAQLLRGAEIWEQYQEWARFKRTNRTDAPVAEATYTVEPPHPALPAGRNVPQPVTDADFEPAF